MAIERMSVAKISGKLDMFDKPLDEIADDDAYVSGISQ